MKPLHVLIADDFKEVADSLAEILLIELPGSTVDVAYDGQEALRLALTRRPDVIILDLEMPGFDGQDVAQRLVDIHIRPPRLIAHSGDARRLAVLPYKNVFECVLYKPTDIPALLEVLRKG